MNIDTLYSIFINHHQKFTTDTRKIEAGDLYFALKGDNFNGNLFASKAIESGAAYAIIDQDLGEINDKYIRVEDVLKTMQSLALHHRRQLGIPFIAVAGSNGKTTTKELLTKCLEMKYRVHATKGNFNNHIGVPITLLSMPLDTEIGVIEIGTNAFGEIAFLCELLEPNFGLITNIGKEHLEGFGDLEGVAKEESALYDFLHKNDGFAFVNVDDVYLNRMSHRLKNKRSFGFVQKADDAFTLDNSIPFIEMHDENAKFIATLQGRHNAQNMAAAICVSRFFTVHDNLIKEALKNYVATNNRSEWREIESNAFMLDAYNANPSSMIAAISTFSQGNNANKVILLGDMFELGSTSNEEHEDVAIKAWESGCSEVYLVGEAFSKVCSKYGKTAYTTVDELLPLLREKKYLNTWFLVKGSRGMKMERSLEAFII